MKTGSESRREVNKGGRGHGKGNGSEWGELGEQKGVGKESGPRQEEKSSGHLAGDVQRCQQPVERSRAGQFSTKHALDAAGIFCRYRAQWGIGTGSEVQRALLPPRTRRVSVERNNGGSKMKKIFARTGSFFKALKGCLSEAWYDTDHHYHIPKSQFRESCGGGILVEPAPRRPKAPARNYFLGSFRDCVLTAWKVSDLDYKKDWNVLEMDHNPEMKV